MAHKSHTQDHSEDMRRIPGTIILSGRYYFNVRYPQELIQAGLVEREISKKSLRTSDYRTALERFNSEKFLFDAEVKRLLDQIESSEKVDAPRPRRYLADLTKHEKLDLVRKWFVEMEIAAIQRREDFKGLEDEQEKHEWLIESQEALYHSETQEEGQRTDWEKWLKRQLSKEGFDMIPEGGHFKTKVLPGLCFG